MSTKQRILEAALTLFSEKGFESVSVEQIATVVGIKAPSLYKHYKSKQDIFNTILIEMEQRYQKQVSGMNITGIDPYLDASAFTNISGELLKEMATNLFLFFLHDDYNRKFRKMLTIEQYSNPHLASLYTKQYLEDPLSYQSLLLTHLVTSNELRQEDSEIMALHFYSPFYLLLTLCDRDSSQEERAIILLEKHITQFNKLYGKQEQL